MDEKEVKDVVIKKKETSKKVLMQYFALFVIILFVNLPVVSALQFSDVSAEDVTSDSAVIYWETDETSDSSIYYSTSSENFDDNLVGQETGSSEVTDHTIQISGLNSETEYFYYVESNGVVENNSDSYYSFTTEAQEEVVEAEEETTEEATEEEEVVVEEETETTSSSSSSGLELTVDEIPEIVKGESIDISGDSTEGAEIRVYVNGGYHSKKTCDETGDFEFSNVPLQEDEDNTLEIEATSSDGSLTESYSTTVYADNTHPEITVASYQEDTDYLTEEESITFNIKVSEKSSLEIQVNGNSAYTEAELGTTFESDVSLEEGDNEVKFIAIDEAGWESEIIIDVEADTKNPEVEAELSKGSEYYQNRAESDIHGTTEEGATVYLYVYRPLSYEYSPDFSDPWMRTTAGSNGTFSFEGVNFENEPISFEDFNPSEVPSGLESVSIYPISSIAESQDWDYEVFIIAEDETGKTGYWRESVTVHSCYSDNFDFQITDLVGFQQPLRLNPTLIEDGREVISAVFNLSYKGTGSAKYDIITGEEEQAAYQITGMKIQKACAQSMLEDDKFSLGCKIMGNDPTKTIVSPDKTAYYVTWDLFSTDGLDEVDTDYWNEFKDSQVIFPLKITVHYQEYDSQGNLGDTKTQTSCYDLGYYVDIPLDSEKLIPDWLADEGMDALNYTIDKIDKVLPYLEKAVMATGISCMLMWGSKFAVRAMRLLTSKTEYLKDKAISDDDSNEDEKCPLDQTHLFLDSTIETWKELEKHSDVVASPGTYGFPEGYKGASYEDSKLSDRCPSTASLWEAEAKLELAYRWTCDRFFCRAVPAQWTYDKDKDKVDTVIIKQKSCASSGNCNSVKEIENCGKYVQDVSTVGLTVVDEFKGDYETGGTCWEIGGTDLSSEIVTGSNLFYKSKDQPLYEEYGIVKLERIAQLTGFDSTDSYLVYEKTKGSDNFCAAPDKTCKQLCNSERVNGYEATTDGYKLDYPSGYGGPLTKKDLVGDESSDSSSTTELNIDVTEGGPCYKETGDGFISPDGAQMIGDKYAAGYSSDCFVDGEGDFYQCVCEGEGDVDKKPSVRTAVKAEDIGGSMLVETYSYRQDQLYQETKGASGTYYPDWRYYKGRDLPGAFGANYLLDYAKPGAEKHHEVNPNTQFIGMFQTLCLSRIRANLIMLKSILEGLSNCINEAKYNGFADAGMCKTLFSQHVCGLATKVVASMNSECSPLSFKDAGKDGDVGVGDYISAGTDSLYEALDSSVDDLRNDYDNAAVENYFSGGVQGVAQSICMAAFGYDFPLGIDFIQDAAYSVPMKTTAMVFPKTRELTNYNPQTLTAIHNYEVGVAIFPGCEIQSYQTYLTCVGQEDLSHPGVSCTDQGCDCISATTNFREAEKDWQLDGGYGSTIEQGSMIDLPIESPQKVDSDFRYDHVVLQLNLAQGYEPESCFDEGYRDGKFYFPIKDVSAPGTISCQVESTTGKYSCPEISGLFYSDGLAYLQDPYITCYNKNSGNYEDCDTPNMFIQGDEIKVKVHMYTDDKGYCLRLKANGPGMGSEYLDQRYKLPSGTNGGTSLTYNFGTVSSSMFGGQEAGLRLSSSDSATGCPDRVTLNNDPGSISNGQKVVFDFVVAGSKVSLKEQSYIGFAPASSGYSWSSDGYLVDSSNNKEFTRETVNSIVFDVYGMYVSNVLGSASTTSANSQCTYQTQAYVSGTSSSNTGNIVLAAELLQRDTSDGCSNAKEKVQVGDVLGKSSHTETIVIQKEHESESYTSEIHSKFIGGYYEKVMELARVKMEWNPGSLDEAKGIYYYAAAYILEAGESVSNPVTYVDIEPVLDRFFLRKTSVGETLPSFDEDVTETAEFQKMRKYLCMVAEEKGIVDNYGSSSVNCYFTDKDEEPECEIKEKVSICGKDVDSTCGFKVGFEVPDRWTEYSCGGPRDDCLKYSKYAQEGTSACSGNELCCPPTT